MSLGSIRVVRIGHNSTNKRGQHLYQLVILYPKTKVRIMVRIHRSLELNKHIVKKVWHRDVVGIRHVLGVVKFMMSGQVD